MALSEEYTNYAARRMAFWDLLAHDLYHMAYEVKARTAEKWVTEADKSVIEATLAHINKARTVAMREYATRINVFIDAQIEPEDI